MGNIIRRGLDAYKQTMNIKPDAPIDNFTALSAQLPAEKLLKTGKNDKKKKTKEKETVVLKKSIESKKIIDSKESKYTRVAKFFILIGSEQAAEILSELDPEQVEKISAEIAKIKTIDPEEAKVILEEFHKVFSKPYGYSGLSHGGIETARRILYAAKGAEKGEALLNRAVPESKENLFSFLEEFSAEQLVMFLKNETPQTISLILSRLPAKLSADTLKKLPYTMKPAVLKRIAYQKEVAPEVLAQVADALKEKARHVSGRAKDIEIDGMSTLAAILKQGDYAFGDKLISELEVTSPEIGKNLKEKLYTFDDVVHAVDRPIQDKLTEMSERDIAILLKGKKNDFCVKIMSCVSKGRRQLIREEAEILGAVPKKDCDTVSAEFLSWFRLARENGDIILYSDKDVFL